jgi:gluconate 2-dehydrogenase alpha chain
MRTNKKADVVIVGLGAAGGIASYVLTQAGIDVTAIEAGPHFGVADYAKQFDEIGSGSIRNYLGAFKFNQELPTYRPDARSATQPVGDFAPMVNGVGGSSVHYSAQSWRYLPENFRVRSNTIERYGKQALPEGSAIVDWPLTYADLEPYYNNVEYLIGVGGTAGANPFEGPRSHPYPIPPLRMQGFATYAGSVMKDMGYHPFPQPCAVLSEPYHGRPACTYCGFCSFEACWNDSKSSTLVTAIADAQKTGHLTILANSRVMTVVSDKGGNVTGVEYVGSDGVLTFQPAAFVIVSSYIYENNRLLLLSTGPKFPKGLANNGGQVGQYYLSHSYESVNGLFAGKALNLWSGAGPQNVCIDDFNADNYDHSGLGFIQGSVVSCGGPNLPIGQSGSLAAGVPGWGTAYKKWINQNSNSIGAVGAQTETLPYYANFIDLDPVKKDPLGVPVVRVTYSWGENEYKAGAYIVEKLTAIVKRLGATETWIGLPPTPIVLNSHAYGGTRMGNDPSNSVVDQYSIAHEVRNLAVMGGSTFCNTTGYNPTETIEAIAWRSAEHIAKNFNSLAV